MLKFVRVFLVFAVLTMGCGSSVSTTGTSSSTEAIPSPSTTAEPPSSSTTSLQPSSSSTSTESTTTTVQSVEEEVNVYWGGMVTNATGTPERLLAGGRIVSSSPAHAAIEALLDGPNALETEIGMFTSIPTGTRLIDIAIANGVAIIDLSAEFEQSSGSLAEFMRVGQIVFTLTQFDDIDGVSFKIAGVETRTLGSHGIDASTPLDRNDFEAIRALILPERPYPGALFHSGDSISGESNTFEASVEWVVTDADGVIIGEGFTTATNGNGSWGTFDITGVLDAETAGRGSVVVFDTSAKDGSQINIVEYPVILEGA